MYNLPSTYGGPFPADKQEVLNVFERLHHEYMNSKRKRDFCIKRVYEMCTYLLYAHGDLCIMAKVSHKGAFREAGEIGRQILMDSRQNAVINFIE